MNKYDQYIENGLKFVFYLFLVFGVTMPSIVIVIALPFMDVVNGFMKVIIITSVILVNIFIWRFRKIMTELKMNREKDDFYVTLIFKILLKVLLKQ